MQLPFTFKFVISQDPVIFMQAVWSICLVEMVGERPYVVLLKDHEKEDDEKALHIGDAPQSSFNLCGEFRVPSGGFNFN